MQLPSPDIAVYLSEEEKEKAIKFLAEQDAKYMTTLKLLRPTATEQELQSSLHDSVEIKYELSFILNEPETQNVKLIYRGETLNVTED